MNLTHTLIAAACCCPFLLPAAEPAAAAAEPTVRVGALTITKTLQFDAAGAATGTGQTTLVLFATLPRDWVVTGVGPLVVTQWRCDDGTEMPQPAPSGPSRFGKAFEQDRARMEARMPSSRGRVVQPEPDGHRLTLSSTRAPTGKAFAMLAGTFTVQIADGPVRVVTLAGVKDQVGKPADLGVAGGRATITSWTEKEVQLSYPMSLEPSIIDIELRTATGTQLKPGRMSSNGMTNGTMVRTYGVGLPADGSVVMHLITGTKPVVVPFELKDLPVTVPETTAGPTSPAPAPLAPAPPKPTSTTPADQGF